VSEVLTLDSILPELKGKFIAFNGDISYTRDFILKQYIIEGFQKGDTVCVTTFTQTANEMIEELSNFSEESTQIVNEAILNDQLQIIDGYSFRSGSIPESIPGTVFLETATDLTKISISMNLVGKNHESVRYLIWPLNLLILYSNLPSILGFMQTQAARVKSRNHTCLSVLDRGVINERSMVAIESILDGMLESKRVEEDNKATEQFRIKFYKGHQNTAYNVWTQII
jgi:KaiC/GvpD/RAD55 family RecA-like ATPase